MTSNTYIVKVSKLIRVTASSDEEALLSVTTKFISDVKDGWIKPEDIVINWIKMEDNGQVLD
jgi:hypothetical protein